MSNKAEEFWAASSMHRDTIVSKLRALRWYQASRVAGVLDDCRRSVTNLVCLQCSSCITFRNRCDRKYCPLCTPRLSWLRAEKLRWFVRHAKFTQPKHVVLTTRNTTDLDKPTVLRHKKNLVRLLRSVFASEWGGGTCNLEVTNEGRGWHLHSHLLIQAKWIDAGQLAKTWAKIVGQEFAIVKVKDARESSYLNELTKYAAKPAQVAAWSGDEILDYIIAFDRIRTWWTFGVLNGLTSLWKRREREPTPGCECGKCDWRPHVAYCPDANHA